MEKIIKNTDSSCPIGVMDSGVGGLTVLKQLMNVCPSEDYIYFGDTKNLPYGSKSKKELIEIVKSIFSFFEKKKVKAVVLACNTTSATAYEELKDNYSFKIYPLIQSVVSCLSENENIARVGVMATEATVKSQAYKREFLKHDSEIQIIEKACPLWVPIVERELVEYDEKVIMTSYLKDVMDFNPQKVILGCTHYPYLLDTLSKYASRELFINPAPIFAKYIKDDLNQNNMLRGDFSGNVEYYASSNPENFKKNASMFLEVKSEVKLAIVE